MWPVPPLGCPAGEPPHPCCPSGFSGAQAQDLPAALCSPVGPPRSVLWGLSPNKPKENRPPFQARLSSSFCMACLETISASNECFSLCSCPLKCLMNVFCARARQGVCPCVSAAAAVRGAVRLLGPRQQGASSRPPEARGLASTAQQTRGPQLCPPAGAGGSWLLENSRCLGSTEEPDAGFVLTTL